MTTQHKVMDLFADHGVGTGWANVPGGWRVTCDWGELHGPSHLVVVEGPDEPLTLGRVTFDGTRLPIHNFDDFATVMGVLLRGRG